MLFWVENKNHSRRRLFFFPDRYQGSPRHSPACGVSPLSNSHHRHHWGLDPGCRPRLLSSSGIVPVVGVWICGDALVKVAVVRYLLYDTILSDPWSAPSLSSPYLLLQCSYSSLSQQFMKSNVWAAATPAPYRGLALPTCCFNVHLLHCLNATWFMMSNTWAAATPILPWSCPPYLLLQCTSYSLSRLSTWFMKSIAWAASTPAPSCPWEVVDEWWRKSSKKLATDMTVRNTA
jgi:hypothetical protein